MRLSNSGRKMGLGLLVAAIGVFSSCSPPRFVPGLMVRWEHRLGFDRSHGVKQASVASRVPAQSGPKCLKDRVALSYLMEDILIEENKRLSSEKNSVQSVWNGVDLSRLSPVQARFLMDAGNRIHTRDVHFSNCQNAWCPLNELYGNTQKSEGEKAYWFYLKTGYYLGASDQVPRSPREPAQAAGVTYKDYLLDVDQLEAFWRLSWQLPETFWNLPRLKTIYRFPKGYFWESEVCADANSAGYIRLADVTFPSPGGNRVSIPCLELKRSPLLVSGGGRSNTEFFYELVTHEIAHSMDYSRQHFSKTTDWTDLSGWKVEKVIDPDNQKNTLLQWSFDSNREGFCSDYAQTLPQEDWAESVMCFRYEPKLLQKNAPTKYKRIQEKVYQGREYTPQGLEEYYFSQVRSAIQLQLTEVLDECLSSSVPAEKNTAPPEWILVKNLELVGSRQAECIQKNLGYRVTQEISKLNRSDWDACGYFGATGVDVSFRGRLAVDLEGELRSLIPGRQEVAARIEALKSFKRDLSLGLDPRDVYRHCYRPEESEDSRSCYLKRLTQGFVEISKPYQETAGDLLQVELESYLKENTFEGSAEKTQSFFRMIFSGVEPALRESAEYRWKSCESSDSAIDLSQVLWTPFTGGSLYVGAAIVDCINHQVEKDLSYVRRQWASRMGLMEFDQLSITMIHDLFLPTYLEVLQQELQKKMEAEKERWEKFRPGVEEKLKTQISALDLTGLISSDPILSCQSSLLNAQFVADLNWESSFVRVADLLGDTTRPFCKKWFDAWLESWGALERALEARARASFTKCKWTNITRNQRKACVLNQWNTFEKLAIQDWRKIPVSTPYRSSESLLVQPSLQKNRTRLQDRVISELER